MNQQQLPHDHGQNIEHIFDHLPKEEDFLVVSQLMRQLSDSSRIRIFWFLCHCEECVINISAMMDMTSPAISHHLNKLKAAGLIVSRREGKEVYYKAADTPQVDLLHHMIENLVAIACPSENQK